MCLAIPGRILNVVGVDLERRGEIDFDGVKREASLALVPEAGVGDFVIVHAGMAISQVDEEEAELTLAELRRLREVISPPVADSGA